MAAASSSTDIVTVTTTPSGCSFDGKKLIVNNQSLAFIYYKDTDEFWMPAKPVMKVTGEQNITHFTNRIDDDDKMTLEDLAAVKGIPTDGCYGFVTTPDPADYHEGKSIWINESGFYKVLLSASKHKELCAKFQSWICRKVIPSIRKTGTYTLDQVDQAAVCLEAMQTDISKLRTDVEELKVGAIPPPNRLYVGGFLDNHFDYSEAPLLSRLEVCKIFGGIVTHMLGQKGLRNTVAREETEYGHRNVYDDRVHRETFEECLETLLPQALRDKTTTPTPPTPPSPSVFFEEAMKKEDLRVLLRDITDTKLADAEGNQHAVHVVLHDRQKSLWWVFKRESDILESMMKVSRTTEMMQKAFENAKKIYNEQREAKFAKKKEQEEKKKHKAEAKAAAAAKKKPRKQ